MPTYLHQFELDWGWPGLSPAEKVVVRRFEASLQSDPDAHTRDSLGETLAEASSALKGRWIRVRGEDVDGEFHLVAQDGRCQPGATTFDPRGIFPDALTVDDFRAAGVAKVKVNLFLRQETLTAVREEAHRLDRSQSWIAQRALKLAASAENQAHPATVHLTGADVVRAAFHLPLDLYEELASASQREDRSQSYVLARALATAWPAITALVPEANPDD